METVWWALARSEEVTGKKPFPVDIGDRPVVLWRDNSGHARALEDRCPHRRAPLSLGCIRKEGWIQCGYHGWSFDGETGRVAEIPNLKDDQRFPPLYRAESYAISEAGGFVRVCMDRNAMPPAPSTTEMPLSGTAHISLDHKRYLAAMFDDPSLLLSIAGVSFTTYLMSELHEENGRLVMERSCQWKFLHWPAPFSSEYPLTWLTSTDPITGETEALLRDRDLRVLLTIVLAPVPAARGVTAVRWRAQTGEALRALPQRFFDLLQPVTVHSAIDGAALRKLLPSVSVRFEELRPSLQSAAVEAAA